MLAAGALLTGAIYCGNQTLAYAMLIITIMLNWAATPVFWPVTTEYLSGAAAAVSIALINAVANICGVALPPLMGWIKDTTNTYDYALLLVALVLGGVLGLYPGGRQSREHRASCSPLSALIISIVSCCTRRRAGSIAPPGRRHADRCR